MPVLLAGSGSAAQEKMQRENFVEENEAMLREKFSEYFQVLY